MSDLKLAYHSSSKTSSYARVAGTIATLGVIFLLFIRWQSHVSVELLMRDLAAIALKPFYYGAVSNIGIQLWTATSAVCLLGAGTIHALRNNKETEYFLWVMGSLSLFLCLDDLFLLHELVFPDYLGISENFVFLGYAIVFSVSLLRFRKLIFRTQPFLFFISIFLFAFSVAYDTFLSKLLAIVLPDFLGLKEIFMFLACVVVLSVSFLCWRKLISKTQLLLFFLGSALFALSMIFNVLPSSPLTREDSYWVEDGSKFLAILVWLLHFAGFSIRAVLRSVDSCVAEQLSGVIQKEH